MKRRDLERKIGRKAAEMGIEWIAIGGANHAVFKLDGLRVAIPRHPEIAEPTAWAILKHTEQKLGEGWWR
jgi:hypothetical protein